MTSYPRDIYLLSPKQLSPETIAVAFAKTSRSPESFRDIAAELTDAKSAEFHEKWVVGYGHASVAEHAVLHVAIENVSRLAVEAIESNRLASYTEKSTRYQRWALDGYFIPPEVQSSRHIERYRDTCDTLFRAYHDSLEPVRALVQAAWPRKDAESQARWDGRIRSKYVDVCRFFLPAAALANLGVTANARVFEHGIRKMLSHPLAEVREIGAELKRVTSAEVPTLVKYADAVPYLSETEAALTRAVAEWPTDSDDGEMLRLVDYDPEGEIKALAAALYRQSGVSFADALAHVAAAGPETRQRLADECLARMGKWDTPLRELEHVSYTFDCLIDQGGYFEVKRHRMMTQTPQRLTTRQGVAVPRLLDEAGLSQTYRHAMDGAAETYEALAADLPEAASYVVPNGFRRRLLMKLNLREAYHFCELRSAPNAHFSVRRVALRMAEVLREAHPVLTRYMRLQDRPTWQAIEAEHFSQV